MLIVIPHFYDGSDTDNKFASKIFQDMAFTLVAETEETAEEERTDEQERIIS